MFSYRMFFDTLFRWIRLPKHPAQTSLPLPGFAAQPRFRIFSLSQL